MLINQTATASTMDAVQVVYYLDQVESVPTRFSTTVDVWQELRVTRGMWC